jgi:adenosylcobyric acid synthase
MAATLRNHLDMGGTVLALGSSLYALGLYLQLSASSSEASQPGLGLLGLQTSSVQSISPRQCNVAATFPQAGLPIAGYEVVYAQTQMLPSSQAQTAISLFDSPHLGFANPDLTIWGVALGGIFDNGPWRRMWLNRLRQRRGLAALPTGIPNYREQRETCLEAIATALESVFDVTSLLQG